MRHPPALSRWISPATASLRAQYRALLRLRRKTRLLEHQMYNLLRGTDCKECYVPPKGEEE